MDFPVDIWLRGNDFATTERIRGVEREPSGWTDEDVGRLLTEMLLAIDRRKNPHDAERPVFLRGFSWIVNPFETGGVVVAIEIPTGAAVAGPFAIRQGKLEEMIRRVLASAGGHGPGPGHGSAVQ